MRHIPLPHFPAVTFGLLSILVLLTGCGTTYRASIASMEMRSAALKSEECAETYQRMNRRIRVAADVDRGAFQVRETEGLDIFNTALFRRWHEFGYNGIYWSFDQSFPYYPHILNYDLMGDIHYYGCDYSGQSLAGRLWSGRREAIEPNPEKAAKYYEFAAIGHVPRSQYRLGRMLFEGDGISQDEETGIQWITSAALEGHKEARDYLESIGLTVSEAEGPSTYSKLAEAEREEYTALQQAIQARQQQIRQNWATVAIVAVGAYYAADTVGAGTTTPQGHGTGQSQRVTIQRSTPVFCTSTSNISITGDSWVTFANGTISTFCY